MPRLRELHQAVPTLVEQADEIRVKLHRGIGSLGAISPVNHADTHPLFHCLDELVEVFAVGGDLLQQDAVVNSLAFGKDAVYGECR